MRKLAVRVSWLILGFVSLALGALGVILPLVPTTPFILLAAFAFAQSSERLHNWLLEHRLFGSLIDNWRRYGAISGRAKVASVISIVAIVLLSILVAAPAWVIIAQVVVLSCIVGFIVTRPSPPA